MFLLCIATIKYFSHFIVYFKIQNILYLTAGYFLFHRHTPLFLYDLFCESIFALGRKESVYLHEVPGASESEGSRLSNPSQASRCLEGHDSQTLLYCPRLAAPKGDMVRTPISVALHLPTVIPFKEVSIKFLC